MGAICVYKANVSQVLAFLAVYQRFSDRERHAPAIW
jgi:hypothetical protein